MAVDGRRDGGNGVVDRPPCPLVAMSHGRRGMGGRRPSSPVITRTPPLPLPLSLSFLKLARPRNKFTRLLGLRRWLTLLRLASWWRWNYFIPCYRRHEPVSIPRLYYSFGPRLVTEDRGEIFVYKPKDRFSDYSRKFRNSSPFSIMYNNFSGMQL